MFGKIDINAHIIDLICWTSFAVSLFLFVSETFKIIIKAKLSVHASLNFILFSRKMGGNSRTHVVHSIKSITISLPKRLPMIQQI